MNRCVLLNIIEFNALNNLFFIVYYHLIWSLDIDFYIKLFFNVDSSVVTALNDWLEKKSRLNWLLPFLDPSNHTGILHLKNL